jgi:hypothetical protein
VDAHGLKDNVVVDHLRALFASSKADYNYPDGANRVRSRSELVAHIKAGQPGVAWIGDYLGAGKSTLMEMVVNDLSLPADRPMVRTSDVTSERLEEDASAYNCVFVDDTDIRTPWTRLQAGLEKVRAFGRDRVCPVVVSGDFIVRDPELRAVFDDVGQTDIAMEPVDRTFYLEALSHRLGYLFPKERDRFEGANNHLYEDELLECLVPSSDISVATFREVLALSAGIAHMVEPRGDQFLLTRDHARRYCEVQPLRGPKDLQWAFLREWLKPFVTELYPRGRGMVSFDADRVASEVELPGIDGPADLSEKVLDPLSKAGLLHALGTPGMHNGKFQRYCGPYAPRTKFLLYAYSGAL